MDIRADYKKNGFIVLRNFFSKEEIARLITEIDKTAQELPAPGDENTPHMNFYHNLYRRSGGLRAFCSQPKIVDLFLKLIGPSFWIRWDHAVLKMTGGEEYPWHQDNAYSKVKDPSFQLWIAVTDADETTGGLWFQRGSHRHGMLPHRPHSARHITCDQKIGEEVYLSAKAGDVIVFSSTILHRSDANKSSLPRWVYIVEYMHRKHYDPTGVSPYFMVAKNGKPKPEFVKYFRGNLSLRNHLKYYRYLKAVQIIRHTGKKAFLYLFRGTKTHAAS